MPTTRLFIVALFYPFLVFSCDSADPNFKTIENSSSNSSDAILGEIDNDTADALEQDIIPIDTTDEGDELTDDDTDQDEKNNNEDEGPYGEPPSYEEVVTTCQNTEPTEVIVNVSFPERQDCNWGSLGDDGSGNLIEMLSANGNLSIKNSWIRAREEQTVNIVKPQGAILCSLNLKSDTDQIHFDDFFALRVENYILASSRVITDALTTDADGHYIWDWPMIRGDGTAGTMMQNLGKYCGTGDCSLPIHDTPGDFAVNLDLEQQDENTQMNAKLFAKLANLETIRLTATATGDNDAADCYHSGGDFTVTMRYVSED